MQFQRLLEFIIYGGSFNPVHIGHVAFIRALVERCASSQILVVPTHTSPFKQGTEQLPPALRLQMLEQALRGIPRMAVLDTELRMSPPSFTVHTINRLRSKYPAARLVWAMGSDVYDKFSNWYCPQAILACTDLLLVQRAGHAGDRALCSRRLLEGLPPAWRQRLRLEDDRAVDPVSGRIVVQQLHLTLPEVSSSLILERRILQHVPEGARELLLEFWKRGAGV